MSWMIVGAGGALGAMARHGLNELVHRWTLSSPFPTGIFLANVLGSAAIGAFAGLLGGARIEVSYDVRLFLVVGLLGGFTTFSSFSLDTLTLLRGGHLALALGNAMGQVLLGLVAAALAYRLAAG